MIMESTVEALPDGRARLHIDVDLQLAGKIVRFGRGMIGVVSERLFQDFAACLAESLVADGVVGEDGPREGPDALSPVRLLLRALWSRLRRLFGGGG